MTTINLSTYYLKINEINQVFGEGGVQAIKNEIDKKVNTSDIKDNLTSTDTNKPLSAKQGKELKSLIDTKSDSSHTHSQYLTSHQDISGKENTSNKIDEWQLNPISDSNKYPTARLVDESLRAITNQVSTKANSTHTHTKSQISDFPSTATTTTNGLMSSSDKTKLNGVATGATKNTVENSLSSNSTSNALSAAKGRELNEKFANYATTDAVDNIIAGEVDLTGYAKSTDINGKENTSNKTSSWNSTTNDTRYPTEKLVKDSLDGKSNTGHTHTKSQVTDFPTSMTPTAHATTATTYGGGTSSNYGHVKVSDNYTSSAGNASQSVAASSKAVNDVYTTFSGSGTTKNAHTHDYAASSHTSVTATDSVLGHVKVDTALSSSSTNPLQNKAINTALGNKVDKVSGKDLFSGSYKDLSNKPSYTATVNTSTSGYYEIGKINLDGTNNVSIYGKDTNTTYSAATISANGLMSSTDKTNLDNLISSSSTTKNAHTHDDKYYTESEIDTKLGNKENTSNKVTSKSSLTSQSTDTQYPSAKLVYNFVNMYSQPIGNYITYSEVGEALEEKANLSHNHGNINNDGTCTSNYTGVNSNVSKVLIVKSDNTIDAMSVLPSNKVSHQSISGKADKSGGVAQVTDGNASSYTSIGTLSNGATQQTINNAINTALAGKHDTFISFTKVNDEISNNYDVKINDEIMIVVCAKDFSNSLISNYTGTFGVNKGYIISYGTCNADGNTIYTTTSTNDTTTKAVSINTGSTKYAYIKYKASEWGTVKFSFGNKNLQIHVSGWTLIESSDHKKVYCNGEMVELQVIDSSWTYLTSYKDSSNNDTGMQLVPSQYAPSKPVHFFPTNHGTTIAYVDESGWVHKKSITSSNYNSVNTNFSVSWKYKG